MPPPNSPSLAVVPLHENSVPEIGESIAKSGGARVVAVVFMHDGTPLFFGANHSGFDLAWAGAMLLKMSTDD